MGISTAEYRMLTRQRDEISTARPPARPQRATSAISLPVAQLEGVILAFDPSSTNCGWAAVDVLHKTVHRLASGCWHPSEAKAAPERFEQLANHVADCIRSYHPLYVVVELPNRNGLARANKFGKQQILTYGRAVGVVEGVARLMCPDSVVSPDVEAWKGRGSKATTMLKTRLRLGYQASDDNEADALGMCLWLVDAVK